MGILPAIVWTSEISFTEPDDDDYDLLESLECPDHLSGLELYDEEVWDSFCKAHYEDILFLLEQCCDSSGILLSQEIRETRLQTAPLNEQRNLENFIRATEPEILDQVAYFVFWLVRFGRARRTGSAELALL
jgi:hypothetical protein